MPFGTPFGLCQQGVRQNLESLAKLLTNVDNAQVIRLLWYSEFSSDQNHLVDDGKTPLQTRRRRRYSTQTGVEGSFGIDSGGTLTKLVYFNPR